MIKTTQLMLPDITPFVKVVHLLIRTVLLMAQTWQY